MNQTTTPTTDALLAHCDRRALAAALRDGRELLADAVGGDVVNNWHVLLYRYLAACCVWGGQLRPYARLARRRRGRASLREKIPFAQYQAVRELVAEIVECEAQASLAIQPAKDDVDGHRGMTSGVQVEEYERARRVDGYRAQAEAIATRGAGLRKKDDRVRQGPAARQVLNVDLMQVHASARAAAGTLGLERQAADLRKRLRKAEQSAARRERRPVDVEWAGYRWRYTSNIVTNVQARETRGVRQARRVVCLDMPELPPFESLGEAARFAGVTHQSLRRALGPCADGVVGAHRFAWADGRQEKCSERQLWIPAAVAAVATTRETAA